MFYKTFFARVFRQNEFFFFLPFFLPVILIFNHINKYLICSFVVTESNLVFWYYLILFYRKNKFVIMEKVDCEGYTDDGGDDKGNVSGEDKK